MADTQKYTEIIALEFRDNNFVRYNILKCVFCFSYSF
jgi:hypothetical protein